jgi:hypothetical protein
MPEHHRRCFILKMAEVEAAAQGSMIVSRNRRLIEA